MGTSFGWYDGIILVILLLSGTIALYRGFLREALGVAGWIAAACAGLYSYPHVAELLEDKFQNSTLANITAGFIAAICVLIIFALITSFLVNRVRGSFLNSLDKSLGFLFGLVRGYLIVLLLYILALIVIPFEICSAAKDNFALNHVRSSLSLASYILPKEIVTNINKRLEDADEITSKKLKEKKDSAIPKPKDKIKEDIAKNGYEALDREELTDLIGNLSALIEAKDKISKKNQADDSGDDDEYLPEDYESIDLEEEQLAKEKERKASKKHESDREAESSKHNQTKKNSPSEDEES